MSRRRPFTIIPPRPEFPVPMPEPAPVPIQTGEWLALVELTIPTVRPGSRKP